MPLKLLFLTLAGIVISSVLSNNDQDGNSSPSNIHYVLNVVYNSFNCSINLYKLIKNEGNDHTIEFKRTVDLGGSYLSIITDSTESIRTQLDANFERVIQSENIDISNDNVHINVPITLDPKIFDTTLLANFTGAIFAIKASGQFMHKIKIYELNYNDIALAYYIVGFVDHYFDLNDVLIYFNEVSFVIVSQNTDLDIPQSKYASKYGNGKIVGADLKGLGIIGMKMLVAFNFFADAEVMEFSDVQPEPCYINITNELNVLGNSIAVTTKTILSTIFMRKISKYANIVHTYNEPICHSAIAIAESNYTSNVSASHKVLIDFVENLTPATNVVLMHPYHTHHKAKGRANVSNIIEQMIKNECHDKTFNSMDDRCFTASYAKYIEEKLDISNIRYETSRILWDKFFIYDMFGFYMNNTILFPNKQHGFTTSLETQGNSADVVEKSGLSTSTNAVEKSGLGTSTIVWVLLVVVILLAIGFICAACYAIYRRKHRIAIV